MTTSSHRPFGFYMPGPMPAPVPLHQAPAAQPAPAVPPAFTGTVPLVVPLARREPVPVCVTCGARHGALVPSGDCYESGALKFICASRDCVPGPLEPAVLTGPQDAQPRPPLTPTQDLTRSYDASAVEAIAAQARLQERAEMRAELTAAAEAVETAEWFHTAWLGTAPLQAGCQAVRELCEGRPEHYHVPVTAVLRALDGPCPTTDPQPMTLTWDNLVAPPAGDRPGETTLIGCETRFGGRAVLELTDAQRQDLAARLADTVHPAEACATPGCGLPDDTLNAASPSVSGWIRLDVAGTSDGPRWWCSPPCATAAMTAAGAELAAADQLSAVDPAQQAPAEAEGLADDGEAHCARCGCSARRRCPGGCYWVLTAALVVMCSSCASPQELAYGASRPQDGQEADA
ncbi:hypothetical protein PV516_40645 [Streptomyces scabiei]|uniref:hypothetical protein n=1 Tax=Streptomyces scabiei TaxID=1930 RepID=UPI0029B3EE93|nr:hypothetical protein [Streptomyces scabiei]MDX3170073.1 hypothetical protein [Streptomyces scabiei]